MSGATLEVVITWAVFVLVVGGVLFSALGAHRRRRRGEEASNFDSDPADGVIMGPFGPGGRS